MATCIKVRLRYLHAVVGKLSLAAELHHALTGHGKHNVSATVHVQQGNVDAALAV